MPRISLTAPLRFAETSADPIRLLALAQRYQEKPNRAPLYARWLLELARERSVHFSGDTATDIESVRNAVSARLSEWSISGRRKVEYRLKVLAKIFDVPLPLRNKVEQPIPNRIDTRVAKHEVLELPIEKEMPRNDLPENPTARLFGKLPPGLGDRPAPAYRRPPRRRVVRFDAGSSRGGTNGDGRVTVTSS